MDYGFTFNTSCVKNSDGVHAAAHVTGSDGLDINSQVSGENTEEVFKTLMDELCDSIIQEYLGDGSEDEKLEGDKLTKEEKDYNKLMDYVDSLEKENRELKTLLHKSDRKKKVAREQSEVTTLDKMIGDVFSRLYRYF